jgi:hypothetical protein
MIDEMFSGYKRVLEALANDPGIWKEIDFSWLIDPHPEKYTNSINNDGRIV